MKKNITLLVTSAILFCSCQKTDQYLNEDPAKSNLHKNGYFEHKPNAEVKGCSILQINYSQGNRNDILQFSYNSDGDPVSITRSLGPSTGSPNFLFRYDRKNRLSDFIGPYADNQNAEFWHKYFYDNQDNIILDSGYIFPRISNGFPENAFSRQLTYYTYDHLKRIIRDSTVFSNGLANLVHTYSYNENGNLTGQNYNDNLNVNRTNKIWMFLNRDYSINNSLEASSYNETGLPLIFTSSSLETGFSFLGNFYNSVQITYDCNKKN